MKKLILLNVAFCVQKCRVAEQMIDGVTDPVFDSVSTDTINEETAAAGVTIDGALIKDSTIALDDGTVSNLSVKLGSDKNNGIYGVSDTQLGIAVEGALVGGANSAGLFTNAIAEQTAASGVTVDGVLLKDGGVSSNSMFATFMPTGIPQSLSGPGVINLTSYKTYITTTGADAFTLADSTQAGQLKYIVMAAHIGDATLTLTGYTSVVFDTIGDALLLMWNGTAWKVVDELNTTINA